MAESDADRSVAAPVTTEEADRLSEQFKPSWEDDPPTVPREQPVPTPRPAAQPKVSAPAPAAAPIPRAPVVAVTADKPSPPRTGVGSKATPDETPLALKSPKQPTLLGMSPSPPARGPSGAHGASADDLDWEITTNPQQPDDPPMVDVEELPPESKPSGIGQTYKPKDEGAPAVMLGRDIEAAEVGAQAELEAMHRARRAPTIAKLKAIDIPIPAATLASPRVELPLPPRKSYGGIVALALLVVVGGAAGTALLLSHSKSEKAPAVVPTGLPAAVVPDTAAPPPPAVEPAPSPSPKAPADEPPVASAAPAASSAEPLAPPPESPAEPVAAKPSAHAPKPTPAKATAAPKPVSRPVPAPAKTAAPKAASPAPRAKGVIVRDNPF